MLCCGRGKAANGRRISERERIFACANPEASLVVLMNMRP